MGFFYFECFGLIVFMKDYVVVVVKIFVLCNIIIIYNFIVNIDIYDVIGIKYICIYGDI